MNVAVIGPFFNDEIHVERWISQLARQTYRNFTLLAVDDASTDKTAALLEDVRSRFNVRAEILKCKTNQGPAAARNLAIENGLKNSPPFDLFLLLDSDCLVETDWIERHVRHHSENPQIDFVGGAIRGIGKNAIGKADGFASWFTAVPGSASGEVKKLHLSTTNLSIKRRVIEKLGGFDETLSTGEDVAYCRRARDAAFKLWFQSDIVIKHLDRNQLRSARNHHYRWGLHSYPLSLKSHGGYYTFLKKVNPPGLVSLLVPVIAALNVTLIFLRYFRLFPQVIFYTPQIAYLKWWNAVGVYHGVKNPELCLRKNSQEKIAARDQ
jgi:GT2 family glycosyltransferase